jgi:transcriptional regulator with XRE-family HTH domain
MATPRIYASRKPQHLYIKEWREYRGITLETLGGRLPRPVGRSTMHKWETGARQPSPAIQAAIAAALQCEPRDLWRPPLQSNRPSVDDILKDADETTREAVYDLARRLVARK